jgi:hypothetical protein
VKTYHTGYFSGTDEYVVVAMPLAEFNKLEENDPRRTPVVRFKPRYGMTPGLAKQYVKAIADQLNEFETANVAVAKLKGLK